MVTFSLKNPYNPDGTPNKNKTLIYLVCHFNSRRVKLSTGQKIKPEHWNPESHRPRKGAPNSATLTVFLDKRETLVKAIHLKLLTEFGIVTPDRLKAEIERELQTGGKRETFVEFITRYIPECKAKESTRKIYKTTLKHLKAYPGHKDFEDINAKWFENYQEYLEGKGENGFSANYIGKNITYLKIFLTEAVEQGLTRNLDFRSNRYKKPGEEAETIYLTEFELLHMYGIELPDYLDKARDRFLIGAFTGLRFSDFNKITPDSLINGMITDKNIKTGELVIIPLHWVVGQIMAKYKDGFPRPISNQKMNDYLKLIAERAGVEDVIIKHRTNGGVRTEKTFKKWELVTTHTARRSFATNAYLAGIPAISIRMITGHRTEVSFLKYIRISQEENARYLSNHLFFQSPV